MLLHSFSISSTCKAAVWMACASFSTGKANVLFVAELLELQVPSTWSKVLLFLEHLLESHLLSSIFLIGEYLPQNIMRSSTGNSCMN